MMEQNGAFIIQMVSASIANPENKGFVPNFTLCTQTVAVYSGRSMWLYVSYVKLTYTAGFHAIGYDRVVYCFIMDPDS